ncbi:MAG: rRNA maturation RNase YbeY [Elusimicrobiota bacterium]|jgi:probable rRNA maturation factor|nr:rRNA maturation RNase YbeY [Elusimicrobiota bacterium]
MQINVFYNAPLPKRCRATSKYKAAARAALGVLKRKKGELNIIIVSGKQMRRINKQFLNHDYVTDVISFGYDFCGEDKEPFGDIFVCFEQAKKQALEQKHGALFEMLTLIAHGALHLAGHNDNTDKLRTAMNAKAEQIAKLLT